jgi:hypothetical protein
MGSAALGCLFVFCLCNVVRIIYQKECHKSERMNPVTDKTHWKKNEEDKNNKKKPVKYGRCPVRT